MGHCLQIVRQDYNPPQRGNAVLYHQAETENEVHTPPVHLIRGPPAPKQHIFQPNSLQNLASEAIRLYIYNFAFNLIVSLGRNSKYFQNAVQDCSALRKMLHLGVPVHFANEITGKLIISVDSIYKDIQKWTKEPWCDKILQELVNAIIHPTVTTLDLCCSLCLISSNLFSRLRAMSRLKVLKLYNLKDKTSEPLIIEGLCNMEHLEVLTIHYHCSDSIIIMVGNKCRNLKSLDVSSSSSVTDRCIKAILQLVHLEEINLSGTLITGEGYMKLLNGLKSNDASSETNYILRKFGCSQVQTSHFNILFSSFSNLTEISVLKYSADTSVVTGYRSLQIIRFTDCTFSDICELLTATSSHLVELELFRIKSLNVKMIGQRCGCLERLTINGYVRHIPQYENSNVVLPGFQSLQYISLNLYRDYSFIAYLLSECSNVKKVDLFITDGSEQETDMTIEFIASRNPLQKLEELSIRTHMAGFLTKRSVMLLIQQCPNLRILRGVNTWSSIGILEDFIEEMSDLFPHIQLSE